MKKYFFLILSAVLCNAIFPVTNGASVYTDDHKNSIDVCDEPGKISGEDYDKLYSDKKLGSFVENGKTWFRLFAPSADKVTLVTYDKIQQKNGTAYEMTRDSKGVWETSIDGERFGLFYGYKVSGGDADTNTLPDVVCVDPYAKAIATFNTYMSPRRSVVYNDSYNWEGDSWIEKDWRDLVIYEMHVRDITAHPSSGAAKPGTYAALTQKGITGGLDYIKSLGVNTVELLPAQEYANIEIPYKQKHFGKTNTWNPYERNHWGYMTAGFFAPAAYYAEDWNELKWNTWMGTDGSQVTKFKDMVKAFHKEGIGVIMDVVYNHVSEYELGNFKQIDRKYYFRLNDDGSYRAESGCGNDFKTERPMARRLIVESILYWMKEYHVDGFRFDLGKLIDWETVEEIIREAKKLNPNVVIVCEPWGGGYDPAGFSLRGWGSWNDQIRNGVKGENPGNGHGWIFGKWYGNNNINRIKSYVNGTLVRDSLGLFQKKEHSVNYLESHDGYTLGDFIRIGTGEVKENQIITNTDKNAALSPLQMKLNKLGAMFLMTSQGMTMISSGQEYARSKVIPRNVEAEDTSRGRIDHNTYNKDNETNYIDYNHVKINRELVDYYRGLTAIRNKYSAFRRADYDEVSFIESKDHPFALAYTVKHDNENLMVVMNAENNAAVKYDLPEGSWNVLADGNTAGLKPIQTVRGKVTVQPKTGMILIKAE